MIKTWSRFNYGFDVTADNQYIDFDEPDAPVPITATVPFGNYTIGEGMLAVQNSLRTAGRLLYEVSIDRATGLVTISADEPFDLLLSSGVTAAASIFEQLGFTQGTDLIGQTSYTGITPCGTVYYPQFLLQSYVPPEHYIESVDATVNRSADGRIEVVRFGEERKIEMDIKFITSLPMDGTVIKNNPNGLEDALSFLRYITQKKRFEFCPDVSLPNTVIKVILENFPGNRDGTGFKLKELFGQNIPDIYETGVMTLRVVS